MNKVYDFNYNIFPDNSPEKFKETLLKIERNYPKARKEKLLIDVDGSTIQIYHICGQKVIVYDDYEVGAVYVCSDVNLENIFKENDNG